jgi:hypothetical protein
LDNCDFYGKAGTVRTTDTGINIRGPHSGVKVTNCLVKDIGGFAYRFNDNANLSSPVMRDVIVSGCTAENATDVGFQVVSKTATGTGTVKEIHFLGCIAKDTNSVTSGSGFQLNITQAGATISNIYFRGCRAYKTSGSNMTWGLSLVRSNGTVDEITISDCDWSGTVNGNMYFDAGATNVHYNPPIGKGTNITAAATIGIPQDGTVFHVTGTTNITNGVTVNAWDNGRMVTIIFDDILTMSDTGTSVLAAAYITTTSDTLTLRCDGTNWYEVSRSAN